MWSRSAFGSVLRQGARSTTAATALGSYPPYIVSIMSQTESATDVGTRFLEALASRDYETLGACFAADGTLRGVVPPGLREADGRDAITERFRIWTGDVEEYEIADSEAAPFADMLRLRWVVQGVDPELGLNAYEQTAYAEVAGGEIVAMRLACSGHRPL